jgi:hypothetical protein
MPRLPLLDAKSKSNWRAATSEFAPLLIFQRITWTYFGARTQSCTDLVAPKRKAGHNEARHDIVAPLF